MDQDILQVETPWKTTEHGENPTRENIGMQPVVGSMRNIIGTGPTRQIIQTQKKQAKNAKHKKHHNDRTRSSRSESERQCRLEAEVIEVHKTFIAASRMTGKLIAILDSTGGTLISSESQTARHGANWQRIARTSLGVGVTKLYLEQKAYIFYIWDEEQRMANVQLWHGCS